MKDFTRIIIDGTAKVNLSQNKNSFSCGNVSPIPITNIPVLSSPPQSARIGGQNHALVAFTPKSDASYSTFLFHIAVKYEQLASYSTQTIFIYNGGNYRLLHYDNRSHQWQIYTSRDNIGRTNYTVKANELYHLDVYFKNNNYKFYCNGQFLCDIPFPKPTRIVFMDDLSETQWLKRGWWQDAGIFCDIGENELDLENRGDKVILPTWFYRTFPIYSANGSLYGIK